MTTSNASTTADSIIPSSRIVQNFYLVWLDGNIDESKEDCRQSIRKLQEVVNTVHTFKNVDKCIDFINHIREEKAFMICSGALGQTAVPLVHDKRQVSTIYIFCGNKDRHEGWAKDWAKIKGVFTNITPICESLKQVAGEYDHHSISISVVKTTDDAGDQNLDTLDPSFMYTQILKEILLTIEFEQSHMEEFLTYCRKLFDGHAKQLEDVDKIENEYKQHLPVWWYTYDSFLYSMLNKALHTMEVDLIIKMGFFIRDLHNYIAKLHFHQYGGSKGSNSFTVYRGQCLTSDGFDQLKNTQGALLSFNNFLSTSKERQVAIEFIQRNMTHTDSIPVLFVIEMDPSKSTTPFADIESLSCFTNEEEILFSMHSIFRIGQVKQVAYVSLRVWQVNLTLTSDNDRQLVALTERIREETFPTTKGWFRLGSLLIKLGQYDKAQQVFEILLKQTKDESDRGNIYHMLGMIKRNQKQYTEAISYYEKSIAIKENNLPPNHPDLAASYNNIGLVYDNIDDHTKALEAHKKALKIRQNMSPPKPLDLANSYNNIGNVYSSMENYAQALEYYKKDLEISEKELPKNHPDLATSYSNIGLAYEQTKDYRNALAFYKRTLEIGQRALYIKHPTLQTMRNNVDRIQKKL